jgi:hypothetical protein
MNASAAIGVIKDTVIGVAASVDEWFDKPEEVRSYKPSEGWSISEVLEHIMLTNHYLLLIIEKHAAKAKRRFAAAGKIDGNESYDVRLKRIDTVGIHRSFAWVRPEHMEPKGEVTIGEVRKKMGAQFVRCLEILDELKNGEGALAKTTMTVNDLEKLDVYEYIYFLAMHAKRHITQMEKIELNRK